MAKLQHNLKPLRIFSIYTLVKFIAAIVALTLVCDSLLLSRVTPLLLGSV